jgi:hypothetical protein
MLVYLGTRIHTFLSSFLNLVRISHGILCMDRFGYASRIQHNEIPRVGRGPKDPEGLFKASTCAWIRPILPPHPLKLMEYIKLWIGYLSRPMLIIARSDGLGFLPKQHPSKMHGRTALRRTKPTSLNEKVYTSQLVCTWTTPQSFSATPSSTFIDFVDVTRRTSFGLFDA